MQVKGNWLQTRAKSRYTRTRAQLLVPNLLDLKALIQVMWTLSRHQVYRLAKTRKPSKCRSSRRIVWSLVDFLGGSEVGSNLATRSMQPFTTPWSRDTRSKRKASMWVESHLEANLTTLTHNRLHSEPTIRIDESTLTTKMRWRLVRLAKATSSSSLSTSTRSSNSITIRCTRTRSKIR